MTLVQQICLDALEEIGVASIHERPSEEYYARALRRLNILLKAEQGAISFLNTRANFTVSNVPGHALSIRPIEITAATFVDGNSTSPLTKITRQEYDNLPASSGTPTLFYYDRQVDTATIYLWPVLDLATGQTVQFTYEREFADMALEDNVDVPSEWERAVILRLADDLQNTFGVSIPDLRQRADDAWNIAEGFDAEDYIQFSKCREGTGGGGFYSSVTVNAVISADAGLAAFDALYGASPLVFPDNKILKFTSDNGGAIGRLLQFYPATEYDRPGLTWFDENDRLRVALNYHTLNVLDDAVHAALEVKTSADPAGDEPLNMRTRFSIGTDADYVQASFNDVDQVRFRGANQYYLWAQDDQVNFEHVKINPDSHETGFLSVSGRMKYGYDKDLGAGVIRGESGKAIMLYTNGRTGADWSLALDGVNKQVRLGAPLAYQQISRAALSALDVTASRDHNYILNNADIADVTYNGIVDLAAGGTHRVHVYSDGTSWRYR